MTTQSHHPGHMRPRRASAPEDRPGDLPLEPAENGVEGVSAVELADRKEVQRRHEKAEPRRDEDGVLHRLLAREGVADRQKLRPRHGERVPEEERPWLENGGEIRTGVSDTPEEERDGHDESRDRPRDADVEELSLRRDRLADPDERAERPDKGREGEKVGGDASMPYRRHVR